MRGALTATLATLLCGLCLQAAQTHAAEEPSQPETRSTVDAEQVFYVGVMGEVAAPAVYEFATSDLPLSQVIKRAGGWTKSAKGSIGIVRNAQPSPKKFYATDLEEKILPGDIVIVDRAEAIPYPGLARKAAQQQKASSNKEFAGNAHDKLIQLGFLNMLDRPVVFKIPAEKASLLVILGLLGQPREVLPSVEVIETGASNGLPRSGSGPAAPLPAGTVLAFDLDATRYDLIPPRAIAALPKPKGTADPADKPETHLGTADDAVVAGHEEETEVAAFASAVAEEVELLPAPDEEGELPSIHPRTIPKNQYADAGHEPLYVASLDPDTTSLDEDVEIAPPPPELVLNEASQTQVETPLVAEPRFDGVEIAGSVPEEFESPRTGRIAILVAGIIGVLVSVAAFAVLWITIGRETAHRTPVAATAAPIPVKATVPPPKVAIAPAKADLDALVNDELAVVEERVADKPPATLHGQAAAPRKIRIDAAHTDVKPHVQPDGKGVSLSMGDLVFQTSTDEPSDEWSGASDAKSGSAGQGVLGRALSSVHGANTR